MDDRGERLIFQREPDHPLKWGQKFVFAPDGTFEDIYQARGDYAVPIRRWVGTWEVDLEGRSLFLKTTWVMSAQQLLSNPKPYLQGRHFWIEGLEDQQLRLTSFTAPTDD